MRIFSKCFREFIYNIFVYVYIRVDDNSLSMQISTVVIAKVEVLSSSSDDSHGDNSESTMVVAVDWQWW